MSQPCWIPVLTHGQFFFSGQLYNGWRQSKLSLAVHSNMCIWLNYQTRKDNIKTNTSSKNLTVKISPYKKSRKLLKIPYELWALLNSESGRRKIKPNNQSGKRKISQEANDNSKEKQANRLKRGKNASYQVAIGFRFESHLLTGWRKFSGPITMRSKRNPSNTRLSSTFSWKFLWEVLLPDWLFSGRLRREGRVIHWPVLILPQTSPPQWLLLLHQGW